MQLQLHLMPVMPYTPTLECGAKAQLSKRLHAQLTVYPLECMLNAEALSTQNSLGPQSLSTLPSSPISGFGTSKRPSMATKSGVPGPGAYKLKNTVGIPFCLNTLLLCIVCMLQLTLPAI